MLRLKVFLPVLFCISILVLPLFGQGCYSSRPEKIKMTILVADSLILPFQAIEKEYEARHPEIDIQTEGHGSIQVIRTITEIGKAADAALVADNQLIPLLMYPAKRADNGSPFADWYIKFATNSLVVAYTANSRYCSEINAGNWYEIMSRPEVKIGLADPLIDSLAYRALMSVQLAQEYYREDNLFARFFSSAFSLPIQVENEGEVRVIHIPEALKPKTERVVMRSYNLQILSLLESGNVDYAFEYESVARQHSLQYIKLPEAINLASLDFADLYRKVRVKMDFQRFSTVVPEFQGDLIIYAATIPSNAPHAAEAVSYLAFVLGSDGRKVLQNNFQPPLMPAEADRPERLPNNLVEYVK